MDVQLGPSSQDQPGFYSRRDLDQGPNNGAAMGVPPAYAAATVAPAPYSWAPAQPTPPTVVPVVDNHQQDATSSRKMRKRKADTQDNERLSKRLSLLNLEQNGRQKLYVPVESPQLQPSSSSPLGQIPEGDQMQLDESNKHKVYIYDLDAELAEDGGSSEGESSSSDEARLVFLPDIARHLRQQQSRIPPRVLASPDGQLAGMQLVLYDDAPRSLSVPEEQDGVRKAVAEARARLRSQRDRLATGGGNTSGGGVADGAAAADAAAAPSMDVEIPLQQDRRIPSGLRNLANDAVQPPYGMVGSTSYTIPATNYDPDAMDMDID